MNAICSTQGRVTKNLDSVDGQVFLKRWHQIVRAIELIAASIDHNFDMASALTCGYK
jgi:hypothetical protein